MARHNYKKSNSYCAKTRYKKIDATGVRMNYLFTKDNYLTTLIFFQTFKFSCLFNHISKYTKLLIWPIYKMCMTITEKCILNEHVHIWVSVFMCVCVK